MEFTIRGSPNEQSAFLPETQASKNPRPAPQ
jgi:hypothetical protein